MPDVEVMLYRLVALVAISYKTTRPIRPPASRMRARAAALCDAALDPLLPALDPLLLAGSFPSTSTRRTTRAMRRSAPSASGAAVAAGRHGVALGTTAAGTHAAVAAAARPAARQLRHLRKRRHQHVEHNLAARAHELRPYDTEQLFDMPNHQATGNMNNKFSFYGDFFLAPGFSHLEARVLTRRSASCSSSPAPRSRLPSSGFTRRSASARFTWPMASRRCSVSTQS